MTALVIALAAVTALLTVLVVGLLRSHADILRALHELGISLDPSDDSPTGQSSDIDLRTRPGVAAPRAATGTVRDLSGLTPDGSLLRMGLVDSGGLTLLAFLSSGCLTCAGFWDAFADPRQRQVAGLDAELVIVVKGPEAESEASIRALAPHGVRTLMSSDAWVDYNIPVSPYFILIDGSANRIVGEGAAANWVQVANLLGQALADVGLDGRGRATPRSRQTGAEREDRTDDELRRAGIEPGDPRLYHDTDPALDVPDSPTIDR